MLPAARSVSRSSSDFSRKSRSRSSSSWSSGSRRVLISLVGRRRKLRLLRRRSAKPPSPRSGALHQLAVGVGGVRVGFAAPAARGEQGAPGAEQERGGGKAPQEDPEPAALGLEQDRGAELVDVRLA